MKIKIIDTGTLLNSMESTMVVLHYVKSFMDEFITINDHTDPPYSLYLHLIKQFKSECVHCMFELKNNYSDEDDEEEYNEMDNANDQDVLRSLIVACNVLMGVTVL